MGTWTVTASDVLNATKRTVTDADVAMAGEIVEIYCNRTEAASSQMRTRDIAWIKKAITWQAPKCKDDPDLASKMAPQRIIQDNVEIDVVADWNWILAPLAARALKNLSWKGSRSHRVPNAFTPLDRRSPFLQFENEASDDSHDWEEMDL